MEVQFTPEQEARLAEIAGIEGKAPERLVRDAAIKMIEDDARKPRPIDPRPSQKVCPECGYRFRGNGWDGIDAHWRKNHESVMPYEMAWPMIQAGNYDSAEREEIEDLVMAESRLAELRAGSSRTYSLEEVERELGLAD